MSANVTAKNCSRVYTPVQRGATCWFAAIMMTLFFSQRMRAVCWSRAKGVVQKRDWRAPIADAMMKIMTNYDINSINKNIIGKLEPRAFLRSLRRYDPSYFDSKPGEAVEGASYGPYQHKFFAFLEIPHLSVTVPRGSSEAIYSAYNFDLPINENEWERAVETLDPKGTFVDTDSPVVIVVHREAGESYLQKTWKTYRPKMHQLRGIHPAKHPEKIVYNGREYILDSCILPSYASNACSIAHTVAGVTCNGDKYVYNGWAARSGDPAMGGSAITREAPCALMKSDWAQKRVFCIDTNSCAITNKKKNEYCYDCFKRSSVIYVRDDSTKPPKTPKNEIKTPKNDKIARLHALAKKIQSRK